MSANAKSVRGDGNGIRPPGRLSDDGASAAALFGTLTLSVVETAAPAGVTD